MAISFKKLAVFTALAEAAFALPGYGGRGGNNGWHHGGNGHEQEVEHDTPESDYYISLGPRPFYIIDNMTDSELKRDLQACENGPFDITAFTIGHRGGGTLQFPEETVQSTNAGARMGAGILECDVAFTKDRGLVCRHSLCDLHTTTNILTKPELAKKCTRPFTPANATANADALCCTSDITVAEYQTLCGKQDGFNASARTPQAYQYGTPVWRTELYDTCGQVQTLDSYITLVDSYPGNRNFTPELKTPPAEVKMPFNGTYTQEQYARDFMNTFIRRGIHPDRVWAQSFNPPDIYQWIKEYPQYGKQAVFLDELGDTDLPGAIERLKTLHAKGVNIISPPINYLLAVGGADNKTIVPSTYAKTATASGLDIIAWTFERSGPLATVKSRGEYYFSSIADIVTHDGQYYEALDVLGRQIGIKGLFTDWASTVTYYANCFDLWGPDSSDYKAFINGSYVN